MERFQLFAKGATEFGMWVCNHTDDFVAMVLTEEGREEPINYYNCVRPHHQRLIESDNRYENRRLMIKAQAENKTVAEVKAEAAATGKAADVTELVLAVTPTSQDFKGAKWTMAPLAIRGEAKPARNPEDNPIGTRSFGSALIPMGSSSFGSSRGIAFGSANPINHLPGISGFGSSSFGSASSSFGSASVSFGSSGFGSSRLGSSSKKGIVVGSAAIPGEPSKRPVEESESSSGDKRSKMELPGENAVAGKIGVSDKKVEVRGVEFRLDLKVEQLVSFNLLLSLWDKLEVTPPTASDLEIALKEAGSVAGAITKVYESAEDLILGESKPDCVFFSCGHKITTMELAANITKCPLCRAPIYARIPASEIRNAVVQQI